MDTRWHGFDELEHPIMLLRISRPTIEDAIVIITDEQFGIQRVAAIDSSDEALPCSIIYGEIRLDIGQDGSIDEDLRFFG